MTNYSKMFGFSDKQDVLLSKFVFDSCYSSVTYEIIGRFSS